MIKIDLEDWEENDLKGRIVERISNTIISKEFKLYGDIPDEGCYTPYDKFKNYVANLVADRIFKYMVDNPEIRKRIYCAIDKAEKSIVSTIVKKEGQVNRVSDDLISRKALREEVKKYRDGNFSSTDRTSYALSYVIGLINNQPTAFEIMKKPERGNENGQEEINTR